MGVTQGETVVAKFFAEEGAEGLVLPRLDVAGGPVVEEADAEEVMVGLRDGDRGRRVRFGWPM